MALATMASPALRWTVSSGWQVALSACTTYCCWRPRTFPKPLFDHFVTQLESFLFYYIFTKTPTKDLERNFSLWADELRTIAGVADPVKQRVALNAFVADRFENNMAAKSQELADALKRFTLYSMQQYRTRYLLARLTQHVDMAFSGIEDLPAVWSRTPVLKSSTFCRTTPTAELAGKMGHGKSERRL